MGSVIAARLDAIRESFERECRELGLAASVEVVDGRLRPRFEGQLGAPTERVRDLFLEELAARGVPCAAGEIEIVASASDGAQLVDALRASLRRTRGRMVDENSWIHGGVAWPFGVRDPLVRERGLALYRAPARAAAEIVVGTNDARIDLPAGDCGEIVSAGIWVPTGLAGDFSVSVRYRLEPWTAGAREACFGLFAVAHDGTFRAYAQRVSRGSQVHHVAADLDGSPGPARAACTRESGTLRLLHERGVLTAWHREDGAWTWLGRLREPAGRALIVGAKVWALGVCGPLRATIEAFELEGVAAERQDAPPPPRPDPRAAR